MYCKHCGNEIPDLAVICVHCGNKVTKVEEKPSALYWWLGFLFPIIGFVLWAVWHGDSPAKAKKAGVGALWGMGVSIVLTILALIAYFALIGFMVNSITYSYSQYACLMF